MQPDKTFRLLVTASVLIAGGLCASAQVTRLPLPDKSTFPISQGVWVGDTLYLSGMMGLEKGTPPGDTQAQTVAAIKTIEKALIAQNLTLGDVVMMHVYLAGDPAKENKNDFAGFMAGYTQFFGTPAQPNKPARSAMQVAALVAPGALVEIEVIAARKK
jgi:enamine deaminase RidA (YjgF/YER057c/UK114 family)